MIALLNSHHYKFVRPVALLSFCLLLCSVLVHAQTTQAPIPQPNPPTPVVDNANVIDAATKQRLTNILENLSENKTANAEFAVVTVKTTGDQDIFNFSLAVMRGWGIGSSAKGGLLLVVATDDHSYFTQISRHLEGDLPDGLVGQIQREKLLPQIRQGNYSKGISDTMEAYVATLAQERGFSIAGLDQRQAYTARQSARSFPKSTIFIIIIVVIFLLFSSRGGGRGGGCLSFLLLNSLLNSGRGGGWASSGWNGGGFGGGGGGGSGWGGFSGGGGDAGGGGAGGSW